MTAIIYQQGFADELRTQAARLYDEAFRQKLRPAIKDDEARVEILAAGLEPSRSIAAIAGAELVGLAGFHDAGGALTSGITLGSIRHRIGFLRAIRAIAILGLLDRKPGTGELLMDGIVVRSDHRGRGIGSNLFAQLEQYCRSHDYKSIRLDVVDTNPDARRLYERLGFKAVKTEHTPYMKWMGFTGSTTMAKSVTEGTRRAGDR